MKHDKAAIDRFYRAARNRLFIHPEDAEAAARLINDAALHIPEFRTLMNNGKQKRRGQPHDITALTFDDLPMQVALALLLGHCTKRKAMDQLSYYWPDIKNDKTLKKYLDQLCERARGTAAFVTFLESQTQPK